MKLEAWLVVMRKVWDTLGAVEAGRVTDVDFKVELHPMAAGSADAGQLQPNDGRPKVFTLVVTTSG